MFDRFIHRAKLPRRPSRAPSTWKAVVEVLGESLRRFMAHRGDTLGSAIAFQALLAMAPLLLIAVAALGLWLDEGEARHKTLQAVGSLFGGRGRAVVSDWIESAADHAHSATLNGAGLFAFGASRFVVELDVAFDVIFDTGGAARPSPGARALIRGFLVDRARALALTVSLGLLIAFSIGLDQIVDDIGLSRPMVAAALPILRVIAMPLVITMAFAAFYRWLPPVRLDWTEAFLGAFVTALLFDAGVWILRGSFASVDVGAGYGAAGALVGVLFWLWYTAQIVIFGAEMTATIAARRAHRLASRGAPEVPSGAAAAT